jgi:hypothetical protein
MANLNTIKNWFKTGLKPTQQQFWDTWDSFWHKDDAIPVANIEGIDNLLNQKANKSVVDDHLTSVNAHAELFLDKEDKSKKGQAGGYAPLDEFGKILSDYLRIVDDSVTGGRSSVLSAQQGKELQTQVDQIKVLLHSNDVNLDNIQELVDAIKNIQTSLSTILVNDLTTGGVTKALTAEQGKALKLLIDQKRSISGTQYSYVAGNGTPTQNAAELFNAYISAQTLSGLSSTNRFKIIVGPGKYHFSSIFYVQDEYIDIVSLTGDSDVEFDNGIFVFANNVYLKGLKTSLDFGVSNNLNLLVCEKCVGGNNSFGNNFIASGTFINCIAGENSFGSYPAGSATGKFINCKAGNYSFNNASGILTNCEAGEGSFNFYASGTFTNCVGGHYSFGNSTPGGITGKLFYCRLSAGAFVSVSNGGRTYYCVDGNGNPNNQ